MSAPVSDQLRCPTNVFIVQVRSHHSAPSSATLAERGTLKMRDWNMQDRNMRHQIAGVEYAGLENTAPTWNEKSREHR